MIINEYGDDKEDDKEINFNDEQYQCSSEGGPWFEQYSRSSSSVSGATSVLDGANDNKRQRN